MDLKNFTLESRPISIASFANHKEATFLISVLDEPDAYGRIIPKEAGEQYHQTIVGYPIVAKLIKNVLGKPTDFGGHELVVTKDKNGKKHSKFNTIAIGSVVESWIEEREVDGYEGTPNCILIKAKLWTSRFPEYFKVFDKLWEEGNIQSSWELTASDVEEKDGFSIYKVFEFIGNALLGRTKKGAVHGAGVLEFAEFYDFDTELAEALEKDMADLDINDEEMEEVDLAGRKKNAPVEETVVEEIQVSETTETETTVVEETQSEVEETQVSEAEEQISETVESTEEPTTEEAEETHEVASLTGGDLFSAISKACRTALDCNWGYISYWFPEEKTVWFKPDCVGELDYKLFTYEVSNDKVTVSEPQDVKLTVSVASFEAIIAEKDVKIAELETELASKDDAVIKAGEKITQLNVEISELKPYKEAAEKAEQERIEAEIAEAKENLKQTIIKTKLFTDEEIASAEIAELIESRNEDSIKKMIAEKYIASFNTSEEETVSTASFEEKASPVANLNSDDVEESSSNFMRNFLKRK